MLTNDQLNIHKQKVQKTFTSTNNKNLEDNKDSNSSNQINIQNEHECVEFFESLSEVQIKKCFQVDIPQITQNLFTAIQKYMYVTKRVTKIHEKIQNGKNQRITQFKNLNFSSLADNHEKFVQNFIEQLQIISVSIIKEEEVKKVLQLKNTSNKKEILKLCQKVYKEFYQGEKRVLNQSEYMEFYLNTMYMEETQSQKDEYSHAQSLMKQIKRHVQIILVLIENNLLQINLKYNQEKQQITQQQHQQQQQQQLQQQLQQQQQQQQNQVLLDLEKISSTIKDSSAHSSQITNSVQTKGTKKENIQSNKKIDIQTIPQQQKKEEKLLKKPGKIEKKPEKVEQKIDIQEQISPVQKPIQKHQNLSKTPILKPQAYNSQEDNLENLQLNLSSCSQPQGTRSSWKPDDFRLINRAVLKFKYKCCSKLEKIDNYEAKQAKQEIFEVYQNSEDESLSDDLIYDSFSQNQNINLLGNDMEDFLIQGAFDLLDQQKNYYMQQQMQHIHQIHQQQQMQQQFEHMIPRKRRMSEDLYQEQNQKNIYKFNYLYNPHENIMQTHGLNGMNLSTSVQPQQFDPQYFMQPLINNFSSTAATSINNYSLSDAQTNLSILDPQNMHEFKKNQESTINQQNIDLLNTSTQSLSNSNYIQTNQIRKSSESSSQYDYKSSKNFVSTKSYQQLQQSPQSAYYSMSQTQQPSSDQANHKKQGQIKHSNSLQMQSQQIKQFNCSTQSNNNTNNNNNVVNLNNNTNNSQNGSTNNSTSSQVFQSLNIQNKNTPFDLISNLSISSTKERSYKNPQHYQKNMKYPKSQNIQLKYQNYQQNLQKQQPFRINLLENQSNKVDTDENRSKIDSQFSDTTSVHSVQTNSSSRTNKKKRKEKKKKKQEHIISNVNIGILQIPNNSKIIQKQQNLINNGNLLPSSNLLYGYNQNNSNNHQKGKQLQSQQLQQQSIKKQTISVKQQQISQQQQQQKQKKKQTQQSQQQQQQQQQQIQQQQQQQQQQMFQQQQMHNLLDVNLFQQGTGMNNSQNNAQNIKIQQKFNKTSSNEII